MKSDRAPFAKTAITDQAASEIVRKLFSLENGWVLREMRPDYAVDYQIEFAPGQRPTGKWMAVQQKGHRSIDLSSGEVYEVISVAHAKYWSAMEQPVLLLSVDVTTGAAFWLFVHEWLDANKGWEGKKTVRFKIPLKNRWDDWPRFKQAFENGIKYVRDKFPGSVEAAIRAETLRLGTLDPRFDVSLSYSDKKRIVTLSPKEPVPLNFSVHGKGVDAIRRLLEFGQSVRLTSGEFSMDDFPLASQLVPNGTPTVFEFNPEGQKCDICMVLGNEGQVRHTISAIGTRGTRGGTIVGEVFGSPLRFELVFQIENDVLLAPMTLNVSWRYEAWKGHLVSELQSFQIAYDFVKAVARGDAVSIEIRFNGRRLTNGTLGKRHAIDFFRRVEHSIDLIQMARELDTRLHVGLRLPDVTDFDASSVRMAHALLCGSGFTPNSDAVGNGILSDAGSELVSKIRSGAEGAVMMSFNSFRVAVFGSEIELAPVVEERSRVLIEADENDLRAFESGQTHLLKIRFKNLDGSVNTLRRATASDLQ